MKIFQRVVHGLAVIAVISLWWFLGFVALLNWALVLVPEKRFGVECGICASVVVFVGLAIVCIRKGVRNLLLGIWAGVAIVPILWLWLDCSREDLPVVQGRYADQQTGNYQQYLWMSHHSSWSRVHERNAGRPFLSNFRLPGDRADWGHYLETHREEITRGWLADHLGREWVEGILPSQVGGLITDHFTESMMQFSVVRDVYDVRNGYACLLALRGDVPTATELLRQSVVSIGRMADGAGSLVEEMIAVVLLKRTCESIDFVVQHSTLNSEQKLALAEALDKVPSARAMLAHAFDAERLFARTTILPKLDRDVAEMVSSPTALAGLSAPTRWLVGVPWICRILFCPNMTAVSYDSTLVRVRDALSGKKSEGIRMLLSRANEGRLEEMGVKNPLGRMVETMAVPAFEKIGKAFWETDDQRVALLAQLRSST